MGSELPEDQLQIVGQTFSVDDLIFFVDQHRDIVVGVQVNGTLQFHLRLLLMRKFWGWLITNLSASRRSLLDDYQI